MSQALVSIIVPCFKQAHFLKDSLQSVLDQTYPHWECIIVNDGSPDTTETVAQQWSEIDVRFTYVSQENSGLSSARNTGIRASKGSFILPLDADDVLHRDILFKLVPELEKNKELAIVSCNSTFFKDQIDTVVHKLTPNGDSYHDLLYVNQLVATSLFRKGCWEEVGGYDKNMKQGFEDWEFWIAITKRGWKYKIVSESLFYYRKATSSMLVDTISYHAAAVKQYIIQKHRELYIEDFDNCIEVFTYELKASRAKEKHIQQSLEYRIAKGIVKPYRILQKWVGKNK